MLGRRKNLMFRREFVLQCWCKSFRKKRCNCCYFSGCVSECLWLLCCTHLSLLMKFSVLLLIKKKKKKLITSLSSTIIYSYKKIKNRLKEGSRLSEGYLSYNSTFVEYTDYNFGGFLITNLVSR